MMFERLVENKRTHLWNEKYINIYVVGRVCHKLPLRKLYKSGHG